MKLFEFMSDDDILGANYDPAEDKINTRIPSDSRKPVLTLKILNRLKKVRALRRLESLKREDLLGVMYGDEGSDDGMGGGGMGGPAPF